MRIFSIKQAIEIDMNNTSKQFRYIEDKISFTASVEELKIMLSKKQLALQALLEIEDDLDDETFISRANGYATTKWGKDVIEDRIELYKSQIAQIEQWITTF